MHRPNHTKLIISLMLFIILGPMLFAWMLFFKGNLQQIRLSHHGDLIAPPINISEILFHEKQEAFKGSNFNGKWWLVYTAPHLCYQECQNTLYNMQQLRLALGKNTERVERLYIINPHCSISICQQTAAKDYAGMKQVSLDKTEFDNLFGAYNDSSSEHSVGELFILDPNGNMMMHYPGNKEARDILTDIKRLLKTSKIG
jgi:cytochrome oxidase Cu insertion factor (SCO1/SenC/PrrC family)